MVSIHDITENKVRCDDTHFFSLSIQEAEDCKLMAYLHHENLSQIAEQKGHPHHT